MGYPDEVIAMFAKVIKKYGLLSTLVNNAGVAFPRNFIKYNIKFFQSFMDIN